MSNQPNTHFVAYTVEADGDASVYDIIDAAINSDPPTEVPTIAELSDRIDRAIFETYGVDHDGRRGVLVARLVEIFTLGNVPAEEAIPSPQ